jgi:hypothetical protein
MSLLLNCPSQKEKIEKAKEEYEKLLAAGVVDVDKYTIK